MVGPKLNQIGMEWSLTFITLNVIFYLTNVKWKLFIFTEIDRIIIVCIFTSSLISWQS